MKRKYLIAPLLILLLSTYITKDRFLSLSIFNIKKIVVKNNHLLNEKIISKKLYFLFDSNIFLTDKKKIENKLKELELVRGFEIKRIYPNKIKVKIFEKKPVAILHNKRQKKYFTDDNDVISYFYLKKFENLPQVFGDKDSFKKFYYNLKEIDFPIKSIKAFYLFESRRWDLVTKKNQLIKLPTKNYLKSLENFLALKDQQNFNKYQTFDYRISEQLILK